MVEGNYSAWGDLGKLLTSLNQSLTILNWGLTITIVSKLVSLASIYHLAKLPLALLPGIFLKLKSIYATLSPGKLSRVVYNPNGKTKRRLLSME